MTLHNLRAHSLSRHFIKTEELSNTDQIYRHIEDCPNYNRLSKSDNCIKCLMTRFENEVRSYCRSRTNQKVVKWGKISEMDIFWCISITNNVESCKKINEKVQTANFNDLTRQRQELCAENAKNTKTRETKTQITQNFEIV